MVKKILNPETGRMVNLTGKIGQKVLSQYGGGDGKKDAHVLHGQTIMERARRREAEARARQGQNDKQAKRKRKPNNKPVSLKK